MQNSENLILAVGDLVTIMPGGQTGTVVGFWRMNPNDPRPGPLLHVRFPYYVETDDGLWDGPRLCGPWPNPDGYSITKYKPTKNLAGTSPSRNTGEMIILRHMKKTGSISVREAMSDYGMSGGSLTKYISTLRSRGFNIVRTFRTHPISLRRYARYQLMPMKD